MRKIPTLFITFIFILLLSVSVYAKPLENFALTGTVDFETAASSTFSESRIISGTAPQGTKVSVNVKNSSEEYVFEMEVGASGIFSKAFQLKDGENHISLSLALDGFDTVMKDTVINKKESKIKRTLEKGICIPGQGIESDIVLFYS